MERKMKKFMFVSMIVFVVFMIACASNQQQMVSNSGSAEGQQAQVKKRSHGPTVGGICFTPDADTDFFSCNGIVQATESTEGQALRMALAQAKSKCAGKIKDAVKGMDREYNNMYASPRGTDIAAKIQEGYDHIIDQILENVKENCQQVDEFEDNNGRFRVYVGIKISKDKTKNEIKQNISNMVKEEEKRTTDFQEDQYFKLMDKKFQNYNTASKEEQEKYNEEHILTVEE